MRTREFYQTEITFTADELEEYSKTLWNMGFSAAVTEFMLQESYPKHPITRAIPMEAKRHWENM